MDALGADAAEEAEDAAVLVVVVAVALLADAVALARGPDDDVEADEEDFDAGPSEEQPRTVDKPRMSNARMRGSKDGAAPAASPMSTTPGALGRARSACAPSCRAHARLYPLEQLTIAGSRRGP